MFFIPMGYFVGADISWGQIFINNLIPVTIGNIIGGAILIPFTAYFACLRK
jgi:formate/nitrite transporter FocA (FNT family)